MVSLRIDTGPIEATDRAAAVPRDKWWWLIERRRNFCRMKLPYDCREILRFVDEAVKLRMWEHDKLRSDGIEGFIRQHLGLDPEMVSWAIAELKAMKPNYPVPWLEAIEVGKLRAKAGRPNTLARLRRDDPEMAERVGRGELSANAAAVAKGWRKPADPFKQLCRLWKAATPEQRAQFDEWRRGGETS